MSKKNSGAFFCLTGRFFDVRNFAGSPAGRQGKIPKFTG